MSVMPSDKQQAPEAPMDPAPVLFDARREFAESFLVGEGLEIGALHLPLPTPPHAHVSYVDRMPVEELRAEYPELGGWDLTRVDVIDNGELLETVAAESQDFIVANHFLEHCEDPIHTIGTHLSKLKPNGILFYAVPDKRYTFDFRRPLTPIKHMIEDHELGPERSRREHYEEWARLVVDEESPAVGSSAQANSPEWVATKAVELEAAQYSIHMHVWTQAEFLELILHTREHYDEAFEIEAAARQGIEFVVILRKVGPPRLPPAPDPESAEIPTGWRRILIGIGSRLQRAGAGHQSPQ
ncbi:MAG: methyltransferase domain-containing protein [Solirubrobacterales bacterium]